MRSSIIDYMGLSMIGLYCLFVSIYQSDFAELNISFPGLNFPVFIGEILLAFCLIFLCGKFRIDKIPFNKWHCVLAVYFFWLLIKAFKGYWEYGPLSFRTAALFYYPLFAVIGYYFVRGKNINRFATHIFIFLLGYIILQFPLSKHYFWTTCFLAIIFFIIKVKDKKIRYGLLTCAFLFFHVDEFFKGSRSHIVACAGVYIYFLLVFINNTSTRYPRSRLFIILITAFLFSGGLYFFADPNSIKSLVYLNETIDLYKHHDQTIMSRQKDFQFVPLDAQLYNKNDPPNFSFSPDGISSHQESAFLKKSKNKKNEDGGYVSATDKEDQISDLEEQSSPHRELISAQFTSLFRLFIWRDMLEELFSSKALFGLSFGKPQRSRSIETLRWAEEEWQRDGWITPHNSFLHYIYRGGMAGLVIVIGIIASIIDMTKRILRSKNKSGILLVGILVYWIILANFLVILELPYNAIPFWFLFGATHAWVHNPELRDCDGSGV